MKPTRRHSWTLLAVLTLQPPPRRRRADVDFGRALAEQMGREIAIVPVSYFELEQELLEGQIDLISRWWAIP